MKRLLLSTAAILALAAPAAAADLATRYPVKAVVAPVMPVFSWTGFYVGANAGYGGGSQDYTFANTPLDIAAASTNAAGFIAGGQLGYNFQFANNFVLGLETDIQWTNIEGEVSTLGFDGSAVNMSTSLDYFGTVRARAGYAFDRFLPYVTGGFAYGKTKTDITTIDATDLYVGNGSSTKTGWTVGAGVEYAFANNWTFKTEYLYVDLGNSNYNNFLTGEAIDVENKFHTVRAGINYKF
ncbi:outer membrane protein [Xanthobacteraceae bacterium A53D]